MKNLSEYSADDLQAELERRKNHRPKRLQDINVQPLIDIVEEYITAIAEEKRMKDAEHYIYEAAIECVYGKGIFDWINEMPDMGD